MAPARWNPFENNSVLNNYNDDYYHNYYDDDCKNLK